MMLKAQHADEYHLVCVINKVHWFFCEWLCLIHVLGSVSAPSQYLSKLSWT